MYYYITDTYCQGGIPKDEFENLPARIQNRIREGCSSISESEGDLTLNFRDESSAEDCCGEVKRYKKNSYRAECRKLSVLDKSGGLYEDSDISEIYELQNGLCYYTGEPISLEARDYAIDHIVPVHQGGSSWPCNLALTTKVANQEKHGKAKITYWNMLSKRFGAEWVTKQRQICAAIDKRRRQIDKRRKKVVAKIISVREQELTAEFADHFVQLFLDQDRLSLQINSTDVLFPKGFLRQRKKMASAKYFSQIVRAIVAIES